MWRLLPPNQIRFFAVEHTGRSHPVSAKCIRRIMRSHPQRSRTRTHPIRQGGTPCPQVTRVVLECLNHRRPCLQETPMASGWAIRTCTETTGYNLFTDPLLAMAVANRSICMIEACMTTGGPLTERERFDFAAACALYMLVWLCGNVHAI